jgi:1,2-diacylglycerol 3-alpha-glucosyltransferase
MRIALFAESYPPVVNGAATAISLLVHELRQRHEVFVYAPTFPGHQDRDPHGRRFVSYRLPPEPEYPIAIPFAVSHFREFMRAGFDVVHTHSPFALGQVGRRWASRAGIATVTTYHTLYTEYTHYAPWLPTDLAQHWIRAITRRHCNASHAVTVPTEPIREVLKGYGVRRSIDVIPTGVPFRDPIPPDPAFPRGELQIAPDAPIVLYAGRLAREKNLGLLFRAFRRMRHEMPQAVLLLAGAGPWEGEARRMVEELALEAAVRFAGVLDQKRLALCYAASQVFGFPSLVDTQGMVLVEAKAAGLPSVCVGVNGPAIVVRHGVDGLLVADDEVAFAEALLRVIREPGLRAALAAAGLADAERFSVAAMAGRYEQVYETAKQTFGGSTSGFGSWALGATCSKTGSSLSDPNAERPTPKPEQL